jgi:hypothetical protein
MRVGCRFAYARPSRQAQRRARFAVIAVNDRRTNKYTELRLAQKGLLTRIA